MDTLQWSNKYVLGIKNIDDQHKVLFELMNDLKTILHFNNSNRALQHTLNELIKYSVYHFRTEENCFIKYNYPDFETHINIHTDFQNKVGEWKKKFDNDEPIDIESLLVFLNKWLEGHILGLDKKFSLFAAKANDEKFSDKGKILLR